MELQATSLFIDSRDLDLWKKDTYLEHLSADFVNIRLLSLDIFDTLLFRTCAGPTDVFMKAAVKALQSGSLSTSISPTAFKEMRILAEHRARERQHNLSGFGEVTLTDIYAELQQGIGDKQHLARLEVETEAEVCYVNPHIASLLYACKERGIPVALLSDMYLGSEQLRMILASAGLDLSAVDTLLVSCEEHDGKSSGRLFARLKEIYPHLHGSDIVHIGDNVAADVEGASKQEVRAVHYNVVPEQFESIHHWEYVQHGHVLPEWKSLRKLVEASDWFVAKTDANRPFYQFGANVLGPFLQSLCDWVLDTCAAEGIKVVHPLMREAYLLGPLLENCARMRGIPLDVKPLYVSRQATYLASLESFGLDELMYLLAIHGVKVGELFEMLGIREERMFFAEYVEEQAEDCKQLKDEQGQNVYEKLKDFLLSERIGGKIASAIERSRQLIIAYLIQTCGSPEKLVTIDIGFNGTIQTSLERIVSQAGFRPQMMHLLAVGSHRLSALRLNGTDIRSLLYSGADGSEEGKRISRTPAFLEELMMGEFGSALGYEEDTYGQIRPILAALHRSEEEHAKKRSCQEGVLAFQGYYDYLLKQKQGQLKRASEEPISWSKPLHRALEMPKPEEAQMLGDLTHQDNFCTTYTAPICEEVSEAWFAQGPIAFLNSCNYGPSILNANWPQGMVTRRFPYALYTYYLRQRDGFGTQSMLFTLFQKVKQNGMSAVHVYGTGAFAEQVLKAAWFHGIQVPYWIDPRVAAGTEPWGRFTYTSLEQIKKESVVPHLEDGTDKSPENHTYILATLSDMAAYRHVILREYEGTGITPTIYELLP
ncbi:HAD family hydrolase [Paenibacillus sp. N3.4]|uniref:HAD family hydrolase n=1 Tax=Paenibacillus sp. N3.4 TaxID=2603222 RepID=UPI0011C7295B|nr:HAD family hydrolase [Paenibacillus sp. N3.4]TXK74446.1 hypothetical protein FU659_29490 [Paenibacillus sp. N3.4]